jgi:hypothetical protein
VRLLSCDLAACVEYVPGPEPVSMNLYPYMYRDKGFPYATIVPS